MNAIDFVARTRAGATHYGSVGGAEQGSTIPAGNGEEISLNLRQSDLRGYDRAGDDLLITLADGRVIVIEGYFADAGEAANRLFLSADGVLNEVTFEAAEGGTLYAGYGPTEAWGKWSPSEELIFLDEDERVAAIAGTGDERAAPCIRGRLRLVTRIQNIAACIPCLHEVRRSPDSQRGRRVRPFQDGSRRRPGP